MVTTSPLDGRGLTRHRSAPEALSDFWRSVQRALAKPPPPPEDIPRILHYLGLLDAAGGGFSDIEPPEGVDIETVCMTASLGLSSHSSGWMQEWVEITRKGRAFLAK